MELDCYEVIELMEGYSHTNDMGRVAMPTCTLIKGKRNCIVNTMITTNGEFLLNALTSNNLKPDDIHYVISTNGDSGNIGNNHLFLESTHIVGHAIAMRDIYCTNYLIDDKPFRLDGANLQIMPTPGRTIVDITVMVKVEGNMVVAITGGLIEKIEDLTNNYIWLFPRPECPSLQRYHRGKVIAMANKIIPGHGGGFEVISIKSAFEAHKEDEPLSIRELYELGLS